jgi:hypothetical protein
MSEWIETFNGYFWLTMGGFVFAFGGLLVRTLFKSKCKNVKLCYGCLVCIRDTKTEEEIEEAEMKNGRIPDEGV